MLHLHRHRPGTSAPARRIVDMRVATIIVLLSVRTHLLPCPLFVLSRRHGNSNHIGEPV